MTLETANRLYELRKMHNYSQEELAEKLGVSRQAVSKWERSEASPDTDNLIALAKIYGLSLDELIYGKKEENSNENIGNTQEETKEKASGEATYSEDDLFINIDDGDDKVKIGPKGIVVEDSDGEKVKISFNGITIKTSKSDEDGIDDEDCDFDDDEDEEEDYEKHAVHVGAEGKVKIEVHAPKKVRFGAEVPYPIICAIAYLICGFYNFLGGWHPSWVIFVTIPIYYSLVEAIYKRRFCEFAYPVFTAFAYLVLGLYYGNWHPSWIIFITIPIYYPIAEALDRMIKREKTL